MYSGGGDKGWFGLKSVDSLEGQQLHDHVRRSKYKVNHAAKVALRVAAVLMLCLIVWVVALTIPTWVNTYSTTKWGFKKDGFHGRQENLQWLGATADIVRGDLENKQDSLAEKALKNDRRVTDMAEKASFTQRERLVSPEDELLKKLAQ